MGKMKCPVCQSQLNWDDSINFEGSLIEGWLMEEMKLYCPHCDKFFTSEVNISFNPNDVQIGELKPRDF